MASLVLGFLGKVAGTIIGGPLGGTIGGAIGATVGNLIDNVLFNDPIKVEGPRLDDLSVSVSTYGAAIPLIYGPENRAGGNIIWSTGLIEHKKTKSSGGKGGPETRSITYTYSTSVAVLISGRLCQSLRRVFANRQVIFDADEGTLDPPTADVGMVATKEDGTHAVFATLRFYQGNGTQQIDPSIEADKGVGNTPAYRHTSYAVITGLQLADFGNVLPILEFEAIADDGITVFQVVADLASRAGVNDVSAPSLTDDVRGFVVSRAATAAAAMEPLALAYNFDGAEQAGQLRFVKRGGPLKATIPEGDMGARQASSDPSAAQEPIRFERETEFAMPREATLSYSDPARDYQVNTQRASRQQGDAANNLTHELPLTVSSDEARHIVDRLLWEAWAARRTARFPLTDKWIRLAPGDVVGLPAAQRIVPYKLVRSTRGANGIIDVEARVEDPEVYSSGAIGDAGELPDNTVEFPGPTRFLAIDAPVMRVVDDNPGFYWGVSAEEDGWRGAQILRSSDGGVTYHAMNAVGVRAVIGDVATALAAGPAAVWDRGNEFRVVLHYERESLDSVADSAVLNGANAAWLGSPDGRDGEIIQFATATLVAAATYDLSNLLRGRFGTEHAIASHGPDEVFMLLDPDSMGRTDLGAGDWYKERLYKPVSVLETEADTTAQSFTNRGEGKRPRAPVHARGTRDGSNNLTIDWVRRTRLITPGLGAGPVPLNEETEAYRVDVMSGATVLRTIAATSPQASYSAAEQTADGTTPGDPVTVKIYQLSASRGRGRAGEFTL